MWRLDLFVELFKLLLQALTSDLRQVFTQPDDTG